MGNARACRRAQCSKKGFVIVYIENPRDLHRLKVITYDDDATVPVPFNFRCNLSEWLPVKDQFAARP
ncbi:hypothetical protein GLI01_35690 [Gluconacetobacter liquefaciens]|nr:hypothetical protein AA0522_1753 [Gluconacetobacter liquefaciens NRIC 0522]GEB39534.1 hypothetical protein GLI01_35690 [Gluconacetobacter liquefaciens]